MVPVNVTYAHLSHPVITATASAMTMQRRPRINDSQEDKISGTRRDRRLSPSRLGVQLQEGNEIGVSGGGSSDISSSDNNSSSSDGDGPAGQANDPFCGANSEQDVQGGMKYPRYSKRVQSKSEPVCLG
jgi:hypothetical protein